MPRDLLIHNAATALAEAGPLNIVQDATSARPGRMKIELITPGWGSSGYYSAATLEAAAKAGVFPAGLQMYADHPTESEKYERPERSIRDLGAVLVTPGTWDGKAIVAEAQVFSAFAGALAEMREHIGVSIRAQGEFEFGEAEGRQGRIITALTEATSVDFVTRAGRGGRIIDVLESIRPSKVTARAIEHGISEATANDTREALQSALVERFGGDKVWLWVRDFDDTTVWYMHETEDESAYYALEYSITDDAVVTLSDGDPVEVTVRTTYVPVSSAGGSTTTEESTEDPMPKIEIDEAEHRRLVAASEAAAAEKLRADKAERELSESRAKNAQADALGDARKRAETLLESVEVRAATKARIVESVLAGLPMLDGKLDVPAFETRVTERATSEAAYEAALLKEAGVGTPSGEGGRQTVTESAAERELAESIDKDLASEFEALGLSESQAKAATAGRG
jgi:hypothetical protein